MPNLHLQVAGAINQVEGVLAELRYLQTCLSKLPPIDLPLKNERGNLTEHGRAKLDDLLKRGVGGSDIARELDITPSAVTYRRRQLEAKPF